MQWELIVALIIAIPIILFPAAYVWYLNIGSIIAAIKEAREKGTVPDKKKELQEEEYRAAVTEALKHHLWH